MESLFKTKKEWKAQQRVSNDYKYIIFLSFSSQIVQLKMNKPKPIRSL
jgi:hypothetical protein